MAEALTVQVVEFVAPMVLAGEGFLQTLATVEQQVAALAITDAATAQQAADIQSRLTKAAKTLDDQRKALNKPFEDQIKAINSAAKDPALRIESAKSSVSRALTTFAIAEQQRVQEENRKRQIELARLQEIERKEIARRKELEDAEKRASEEIAKNRTEIALDDWDDLPEPVTPVVTEPTETQKAIAAVAVPVVQAARPSGVTIRVTLEAIVEDIEKVPAMFIERTVKLRAIQSTYCVKFAEGQSLPVCPGVRFEIKRTAVATGR